MTPLQPLPSPSSWTAEEDRLGFFGPGSVTWRIHTDPSYAVGGIRALLLQALHPVAMDGVARNSAGLRDEPWQRLIRTGQYVETVVFGTRSEARRMAARVRGLHGGLSGVERTTGRAYRVDDPDLLLWVHACTVESLLTTAQRAGVPLTADEADRYVAEQATAGALVGVPAALLPRSVAELGDYVAGIRPSLAMTPAARDAARVILLPPMPGWVRFLTPAMPAWGGLATLGMALLPSWARRMYSLPGFALTDAAATAALRTFRATLLPLPDRARWSPIVRAGVERVAADRGLTA